MEPDVARASTTSAGEVEATLQRRTKGNSRVAVTMKTSLAGDSDGKPAFWPSEVPTGLQTAARTAHTS